MKTLRRMPKSTNIRIDFLDEMTITSITANTFDSHSDADPALSTSRQNSASWMATAIDATKLERRDSLLEIDDQVADEVLEIDEMVSFGGRVPSSLDNVLRYAEQEWCLPRLHGFPYIEPTAVPGHSSSPIASASSMNSSIQTESKFSVRRRGKFPSQATTSSSAEYSVDSSRSSIATSNGQTESILAGSSSSSPSSGRDEGGLICGGRGAFAALRKTLSRRKPSRRGNTTVYPKSSGHHEHITIPTAPKPRAISATHAYLLTNESRLTALDHAWATMGMPDFLVWLLDEFEFVRPSPSAMSWLNRVEIGDTSQFNWLHWERSVEQLVASLRDEDVWIEGDEFGDVAECVIETLEVWLVEG
ncbi:hypothetical protein CLAFUW4_06317 [Fulvia fulva]|uniref:Uncharacterized protein n=1 Tax=Passalora fulva TaxID=5499 RepID=A0A9Q8LIP1_PASFU|nr:uncharacterized protein CLAFUR5_06461 [Fulvia fulva]KAK4624548.1 hypothetical protein CLAFUR4_06320 [Fulvia fulva]KAK4625719.1 hypothetical protein CLAFUR0_06324 [Fulvia fulva]UJO18093.1 hypothetical protein CLAFUR5_06461 [Fulvia fulva]WPV14662.1 hypothetical protein CLAFUW4_06317 [Fulvia fulva]WPV30601.1 hypothetical protein CLAFUW7_06315 [Fulvia fulva]